jgi:hypothetical protein
LITGVATGVCNVIIIKTRISYSKMIPALIHCFWISDSVPSFANVWVQSWKKRNSECTVQVWTDSTVRSDMIGSNSRIYSLYENCSSSFGRMKIASYYILKTYGGIYFDIDTRCLSSFTSLRNSEAFFGLECDEQSKITQRKHLIGCQVIGSTSGFRLWDHVFEMMTERMKNPSSDPDFVYGSVLITDVIESCKSWISSSDVCFYESKAFYPLPRNFSAGQVLEYDFKDSYCVHYYKDNIHPTIFYPLVNEPTVMVSILARNKDHVLPFYLKCIEELDYPKEKIDVYVFTNDNQDDTVSVLANWVKKMDGKYRSIEFSIGHFDALDNDNSLPHGWRNNPLRLDKMAVIRQKSLQKAVEKQSEYYFVADCDNFVLPHTLKDLLTCRKPIVSPMLHCIGDRNMSNFSFAKTQSPELEIVKTKKLRLQERGVFKAFIVHNTYLIDCKFIPSLSYLGKPGSFEFLNFCYNATKNGLSLNVCNRRFYGTFLHFWKTKEAEADILPSVEKTIEIMSNAIPCKSDDEVFAMLEQLTINR